MATFNKYKHLFVSGEYASRDKIVSGLLLEQVTSVPAKGLHSIYEELWHSARWQTIVVNQDEAFYEFWKNGEVYPPSPPKSLLEWEALVKEFLAGIDKAVQISASPETLNKELEPGVTMADTLDSLAMHTAYHMGKIVAVRQMIGAWPPDKKQLPNLKVINNLSKLILEDKAEC